MLFCTTVRAGSSEVYLGKTYAPWLMHHKRVFTMSCLGTRKRPVSEVQFKVRRGDADIKHIKLVFGNGERQYINVNEAFADGSDSEWIELNGTDRCLRRIIVLAESTDASSFPYKRARIHFYGK